VIKLGLDVHARQVTECRQLDGLTPKPAQKWDPWKLLDQVGEWVKSGIKVYSCYEAGAWYNLVDFGRASSASSSANYQSGMTNLTVHGPNQEQPLPGWISSSHWSNAPFSWRTRDGDQF